MPNLANDENNFKEFPTIFVDCFSPEITKYYANLNDLGRKLMDENMSKVANLIDPEHELTHFDSEDGTLSCIIKDGTLSVVDNSTMRRVVICANNGCKNVPDFGRHLCSVCMEGGKDGGHDNGNENADFSEQLFAYMPHDSEAKKKKSTPKKKNPSVHPIVTQVKKKNNPGSSNLMGAPLDGQQKDPEIIKETPEDNNVHRWLDDDEDFKPENWRSKKQMKSPATSVGGLHLRQLTLDEQLKGNKTSINQKKNDGTTSRKRKRSPTPRPCTSRLERKGDDGNSLRKPEMDDLEVVELSGDSSSGRQTVPEPTIPNSLNNDLLQDPMKVGNQFYDLLRSEEESQSECSENKLSMDSNIMDDSSQVAKMLSPEISMVVGSNPDDMMRMDTSFGLESDGMNTDSQSKGNDDFLEKNSKPNSTKSNVQADSSDLSVTESQKSVTKVASSSSDFTDSQALSEGEQESLYYI